MIRVYDEIRYNDEEKFQYLVSLLRSDATRWWKCVTLTVSYEEKTFEFFGEVLQWNYVG